MKKEYLILIIIVLIIIASSIDFYPLTNIFNPKEDVALSEDSPIGIVNLTQKSIIVPESFDNVYPENKVVNLPEDLSISVYAAGLGKVRFLEFNDNLLYASQPRQGRIIALPDKNNDGIADEIITVAESLNYPHGIEFYKGVMYVAVMDGVVKLEDKDKDGIYETKQQIISGIPEGGNHITRTIRILDDKIYLSVGSSCNICLDNPKRAAILQYNLDGSNEGIYASGLRNSVGIIFKDGLLWGTDNGADYLGEDFPPEEINIIEKNKDYGWPRCHGDNYEHPDYGTGTCNNVEKPYIKIQAHSAPLGLRFASEEFPYQGLFVAHHGSWNRKVPVGYKVVRIKDPEGNPVVEDFIEGFMVSKFGRPVDIIFNEEKMFLSDDKAGVIFLIK